MFKIGDRVRRIRDSYAGMEVGDIGTVIFVGSHTTICIEEYGGRARNHELFNFKLVKEEPKKVIKRFGIANFIDELNKR